MNNFYFNIFPIEGGKDAKNFAFLMKNSIQQFMNDNSIKYEIIEEKLSEDEALINFCCVVNSNVNLLYKQEGIYKLIRYSPYKKNNQSRQTSWCKMILIEIENNSIILEEKDVIKKFIPSSKKAGGQKLNHSNSAVSLTHIKTGIKYISQEFREQHYNYSYGMKMLQNKLNLYFYSKQKININLNHIRTLYFNPQKYCKNHITNQIENIDDILKGKLLY